MIEIKHINIDDPGDMSVGIFPAHWELKGDFLFENEDDKIHFFYELRCAFEYISDGVLIISEENG